MMDYTTLKLYYNSKSWGDLSLRGFQLLESIQDTDDELLVYINNGLSKILPNEDDNPKLATYYLNLFRATTIWFKEFIEKRNTLKEYDVFSYTTTVEKELKHVLVTDEIKKEDCPKIAEAIMYAVYVYYTIYDSDNLMLRRKIVCKDIPKQLEDMFPNSYIDNYKCYRYFDKHILYSNYNTLSQYLSLVIGSHDPKAVESYCRERLPLYKSFLEEKPCGDYYIEDEFPVFVYNRSSFLSNDLSASLLQCIRILEERINLIELGNQYNEKVDTKEPISLETVLKDYPKLRCIKKEIQAAIDKGYIEYGSDIGGRTTGILVPRIRKKEPTFSSLSEFIYFIGYALRLSGSKPYPGKEVTMLFELGDATSDSICAYWRKYKESIQFDRKCDIILE